VAHREENEANKKCLKRKRRHPPPRVSNDNLNKKKPKSSSRRRQHTTVTVTTTKEDEEVSSSSSSKSNIVTNNNNNNNSSSEYNIKKYAIGTAVSKFFLDEDRDGEEHPFSGEVVGYDAIEKLYQVRYEDDDEEELDEVELGNIVVPVVGGSISASASTMTDLSKKNLALPPTVSSEEEEDDTTTDTDDMDERDRCDPLCVTDYVRDIYDHFRAAEATLAPPPPPPHGPDDVPGQHDATLVIDKQRRQRGSLVDWMITAHYKLELDPQTLYLAVNIFDRYFHATTADEEVSGEYEMRLAGVTALLIASKYEEIYPPEFCDLLYVSDVELSKKEIICYEETMLSKLEYRITVPTARNFLVRYLKASADRPTDERIVQLSCFVLDGTLVSSGLLLRYLPSQLAAAAVYVARKTAGRKKGWSPTLTECTRYGEEDVLPVARAVLADRALMAVEWRAVDKKYMKHRYGCVANIRLCSDF